MSESQQNKRKGLVIVNTGNGKGKTTAALGMIMRAWGRNLRVCVIQFLKAETGQWGEVKAAKKMNIEWNATGNGFTWNSNPAGERGARDMDETTARARRGWQLAQEKITSGSYDLILLDEFTYPLHFGWLDTGEVIDWLRAHKPPQLHLVITGRSAPPELVEYADLVTEMQVVKHPYEQGLKAQPGIDF